MALWAKNRRKTLFLPYQLDSKLFGTAFSNVAMRVSGCKIQWGLNGTAFSVYPVGQNLIFRVKVEKFWWNYLWVAFSAVAWRLIAASLLLPHIVFHHKHLDFYLQGLEIVLETIEYVLEQPDMDKYYLDWSSWCQRAAISNLIIIKSASGNRALLVGLLIKLLALTNFHYFP